MRTLTSGGRHIHLDYLPARFHLKDPLDFLAHDQENPLLITFSDCSQAPSVLHFCAFPRFCCLFHTWSNHSSLSKLFGSRISSIMVLYVYVLCLVAQSCPALCNPMSCSPPGYFVHGDFPRKNTRVSCHALL